MGALIGTLVVIVFVGGFLLMVTLNARDNVKHPEKSAARAAQAIENKNSRDRQVAARAAQAIKNKNSRDRQAASIYAATDGRIVCPQCHQTGHVHTTKVMAKKGVSGAKLTGAVFTLGTSMVATGLSRKEAQTQARCGNCRTTWAF